MKKELMHRIGAFVCALVVGVSCMVGSVPYYASTYSSIEECLSFYGLSVPEGLNPDYEHYLTYDSSKGGYSLVGVSDSDYEVRLNTYDGSDSYYGTIKGFALQIRPSDDYLDFAYAYHCDNGVWSEYMTVENYYVYGNYFRFCRLHTSGNHAPIDLSSFILYSSKDIFLTSSYLISEGWSSGVVFSANGVSGGSTNVPIYNSDLGYLQNISRKQTYIRGALYNYDEDSLKHHWYHDTTSSSGVDLTSGNYAVRHYISMATVKGYDKEDIVEMSDKYLMAEFDASQGYYSYLEKDYDEKLETLGYEGLGFIEKYLQGYFLLEHHYFQIVNLDTNEVGGYVHLYPKDSSGEFGVELNFEGLDENFEVDPEAPSGIADDTTGSGLTEDEALANADEPKLDDIEGVDQFIDVLETYSTQIQDVSNAIGALIQSLPPWVSGTIGITFGLLVLGIVIKVLGG